MAEPRGLRNGNPGNLRPSGIAWLGLADEQTDPGYLQFRSPLYGIRALARDITTKYRRGLRTVADLIEVYAPPSENDTAAYITAVAKALEVPATRILTLNRGTLMTLVKAIIRHENGQNPYPDELIVQAIALAEEQPVGQPHV